MKKSNNKKENSQIASTTGEQPHPSVTPTRRRNSLILAALLAIIVIGWMGSGMLNKEQQELPQKERVKEAFAPTRVQVENPIFESVSRIIRVTGKTAPNRQLVVRAATSGTIIKLESIKGEYVKKDQPLITLDAGEKKSQLVQAQALQKQRQLQYQSVRNLTKKGLASQFELSQARANLESSKAQAVAAREALSDTVIKAPFDALITLQHIELGDYVSPGTQLLSMADVQPTLVISSLTEKDIAALGNETPKAIVKLATGERLTGILSYVAPASDTDSNTFDIEIKLDDAENIKLGITADVELELVPEIAIKIKPSQLELSDAGKMIIKYVDDNNLVQIAGIDLIKASETHLWVSSEDLPSTARMISAGSGFTEAEDKVNPVDIHEQQQE